MNSRDLCSKSMREFQMNWAVESVFERTGSRYGVHLPGRYYLHFCKWRGDARKRIQQMLTVPKVLSIELEYLTNVLYGNRKDLKF
ncbi:hypothetical protein CEXT_753561 [Caerostris extrusa]|uniref:Transposase n=1 Tax=Caerostris extrusa TaxID=172846 RepID=A0AAV4RGY9_CAEEX|nr:hypothetical protein CEXT_753561 [Caerostris extrusa]